MKAILMTRLDEAEKTHDLLKLYEALPSDSRDRLEADFPEIGAALEHDRDTFGRWRYFEESVAEYAIAALVNTDRVRRLGKAARVIVDECVVVGLTFEVDVDTTFDAVVDRGGKSLSERIHLTVHGGEAAIPWIGKCWFRNETSCDQPDCRLRSCHRDAFLADGRSSRRRRRPEAAAAVLRWPRTWRCPNPHHQRAR